MHVSLFLLPNRLREKRKNAHESGRRQARPRQRAVRAMPVPEANAEVQSNIDVREYNYFCVIMFLQTYLNCFRFTEDAYDHARKRKEQE